MVNLLSFQRFWDGFNNDVSWSSDDVEASVKLTAQPSENNAVMLLMALAVAIEKKVATVSDKRVTFIAFVDAMQAPVSRVRRSIKKEGWQAAFRLFKATNGFHSGAKVDHGSYVNAQLRQPQA
ncbi:hypothetical protein N7462_001780 [Penicillium macrosclerotiorum]|uniref:uncharacterized protein n=1 Tax=Penicillium macrosclerotiorum TaxID=303699 RepID=UPI002548BB79|nr:uncharacterized protein N7462_001780 [Penicillium macrosclerotiorum]KAJ5692357.1 hypothetical protein N7462_001780 [Penicillium macrosclerotiorum]